jgi:hypothetical protein
MTSSSQGMRSHPGRWPTAPHKLAEADRGPIGSALEALSRLMHARFLLGDSELCVLATPRRSLRAARTCGDLVKHKEQTCQSAGFTL